MGTLNRLQIRSIVSPRWKAYLYIQLILGGIIAVPLAIGHWIVEGMQKALAKIA